MSGKWTPEQHRKFKKTLAAKKSLSDKKTPTTPRKRTRRIEIPMPALTETLLTKGLVSPAEAASPKFMETLAELLVTTTRYLTRVTP